MICLMGDDLQLLLRERSSRGKARFAMCLGYCIIALLLDEYTQTTNASATREATLGNAYQET